MSIESCTKHWKIVQKVASIKPISREIEIGMWKTFHEGLFFQQEAKICCMYTLPAVFRVNHFSSFYLSVILSNFNFAWYIVCYILASGQNSNKPVEMSVFTEEGKERTSYSNRIVNVPFKEIRNIILLAALLNSIFLLIQKANWQQNAEKILYCSFISQRI